MAEGDADPDREPIRGVGDAKNMLSDALSGALVVVSIRGKCITVSSSNRVCQWTAWFQPRALT